MGPQPGEIWFIPPGDEGEGFFFRPAIPDWVLVSRWEVWDCYWLSYRAHTENLAGAPGAITATLVWVGGGVNSPITDNTEQPVTRERVIDEMFVAMDVGYDPIGNPAVPSYVTREWAERVWRTLDWLSNRRRERVTPPMTLPARNASGAIATAEELYAAALAELTGPYNAPEYRERLRIRVEQTASKSRQLDRILRSTKQIVGVAA